MVAKVEDGFLGREPPGLGPSSHNRWRWSQGVRGSDHALLSGSSTCFDVVARSGRLPSTWTSQYPSSASAVGFSMGLHNVQGAGHAHSGGSVQPHHPLRNSDQNADSGILNSFVSSYLMQQQSHAAAASAAVASGRAGAVVTTTAALAPGAAAAGLARNPSFESINNTTGSCSTPSFCVGLPATVFPSRPSDSGSNNSLLPNNVAAAAAAYSESRVVLAQSQLSDHYLSNDSLSYGSMEERDVIVNCVVDDFWTGEPLPEFRFEPMLDDTADTSACGLSIELDSLVSTNHGSRGAHRTNGTTAGLSSMMIAPAPDFCQAFFTGTGTGLAEQKPLANAASKPTHLSIPTKGSNASSDHPRLRWSDEPWTGSLPLPHFSNNTQSEKSPTGSSPSSPTTPLDPHLFASSKLNEFTSTTSNNNKRSFATMQSGGEKAELVPLPLPLLRLQGGATTAMNADKFDAAALSALLYSNNQNSSHELLRSSFTVSTTSPTHAHAPPAPKQRRRHGTATDPQSIAARSRREKFTDRIRVLQSLVPNGERLDTVHMLSQTLEYVRFLQHKVWDLYNGKDSLSEVLPSEKWKEFVDTTTGQVIV